MTARVGLMGCGRIGRNIFRILHGRDDVELVAISEIADHAGVAYLLRFDTVLGRFPEPISLEGDLLRAGGRTVRMLSGRAPGDVDWKALGVDYVIVATGQERPRAELEKHLKAGARHVILCAPPADEPDITVVFGVNEDRVTPAHRILSNGSCTAAAIGPIIKVLHERFGVRQGFLTTVHAYTNDQMLADVPAADLRRSRSAAENIIPKETRVHDMLMAIVPGLSGRLGGMALNVPVPDGSAVDLVAQTERPATTQAVNDAIREAAAGPLSGLIEYTADPIVSSDVIDNSNSGIFDSLVTQGLGDDIVRVMVWFNNGYGYAHRALDLVRLLASRPAPAGGGGSR